MAAVFVDRLAEYAEFAELVRRAQAAGQLRPHFLPEDFVVLQMAIAGVFQGTPLLHPFLHGFTQRPDLELEVRACAEGLRKGGIGHQACQTASGSAC